MAPMNFYRKDPESIEAWCVIHRIFNSDFLFWVAPNMHNLSGNVSSGATFLDGIQLPITSHTLLPNLGKAVITPCPISDLPKIIVVFPSELIVSHAFGLKVFPL